MNHFFDSFIKTADPIYPHIPPLIAHIPGVGRKRLKILNLLIYNHKIQPATPQPQQVNIRNIQSNLMNTLVMKTRPHSEKNDTKYMKIRPVEAFK